MFQKMLSVTEASYLLSEETGNILFETEQLISVRRINQADYWYFDIIDIGRCLRSRGSLKIKRQTDLMAERVCVRLLKKTETTHISFLF